MNVADWTETNQRALVDALAHVRGQIDSFAATGSDARPPSPAFEPAADSALAALVRLFQLSSFERDVLLLCAGAQLDGPFAAALHSISGASGIEQPTFGFALAALKGAHWSALTPDGPLRYWRLVELHGAHLTASPIQADERILHFLAGVNQLDERLRGIVEGHRGGPTLPEMKMVALLTQTLAALPSPFVQLVGGDADYRKAIAVAATASVGNCALVIRAEDLSTVPVERAALARLVTREALLGHGGVVIIVTEPDQRNTVAFVRDLAATTVICTEQPIPELAGLAQTVPLKPPSLKDRLAWWQEAVGRGVDTHNGHLQGICAQFELPPTALRAVASLAKTLVADDPSLTASAALWEACRLSTRPHLEGLAERIEPRATWDDLVLPATQVGILREIVAHVRRRYRVYEEWGFADKSARGLGISALFAGVSGTGKTMAAEVLASELRLDLYRIDLASVVSKYIGETEKNLKRLFDAAEGSGAVLLFDEADALFGKRSEVRDSHDRYANIEISYLLQRMDAYRGLAILTTNMKGALDPAFLRRIRFAVNFPFPDEVAREAIWRRVLPMRLPTQELHYERLAQLAVSGGHIRNIAIGGAFRAADEEQSLTMRHLVQAARSEYAKLERTLSDGETRGWT